MGGDVDVLSAPFASSAVHLMHSVCPCSLLLRSVRKKKFCLRRQPSAKNFLSLARKNPSAKSALSTIPLLPHVCTSAPSALSAPSVCPLPSKLLRLAVIKKKEITTSSYFNPHLNLRWRRVENFRCDSNAKEVLLRRRRDFFIHDSIFLFFKEAFVDRRRGIHTWSSASRIAVLFGTNETFVEFWQGIHDWTQWSLAGDYTSTTQRRGGLYGPGKESSLGARPAG